MAITGSGLTFIDNQPIIFDLETDSCQGFLGSGYCQKFERNDPINIQIKREPCGDNLACTDTSIAYGADLITDGGFAADLSNWTAVGFTWSAGVALAAVAPGPNTLTQTVAIVPVNYYRITLTVTGLDTGAGDYIKVFLGGTSGWIVIDSNGAFDEVMRSKSDDYDLKFEAVTTVGQPTIDNVTLTETFYCYNGPGWGYDTTTNTYTHTAGLNTALEALVDPVGTSRFYLTKITITNATVGSVRINLGDNASDDLSSNGTYIRYVYTGNSTGFNIVPTADFDGTVEIEEIYELTEPGYIMLVDLDENEIADLSGFYSIVDDRINISFLFSELVLIDTPLIKVPNGCYKIAILGVCNPANANLVTNGTFAAGFDDWSTTSGLHQYNLNAGVMEFVFEPLENGDLMTNGDFSAGNAGWTFAGWTIGTDATHTPGNTSPLSRSITLGTPAVPPYSLTSWIQLTVSGRTAGSITVTLSDKTSATYSVNGVITFPLTPTIGGVVTISITPTSAFDGTVDDIQVYQSTQSWTAIVGLINSVNTDIVAGNYSLSYDQVTNDRPGEAGAAMFIIGQTQSYVYDTSIATHTNAITNYTPGAQQIQLNGKFRDSANNYFPGRIGIDNVTAVMVEPFEDMFYSNCFEIATEWPCTKWIEAYSDCFAHGFDFRDTFKLGMRIPFLKFGGKPIIKDTTYIQSDGTKVRTSSERDKIWTGKTDKIDEIAHDALSVALLCETLTIDSTEYFFSDKEYSIAYDKLGRFALARATFDLSKKMPVTFANNCADCAAADPVRLCIESCEDAIALSSDATTFAGWYMKDDEGILEWYDGAIFTGLTMACTGYVTAYPGPYGGLGYSGPYWWNEVISEWQAIIDGNAPSLVLGTVSFSATILWPGCGARIQTSIDLGLTWVDVTAYYSFSQMAAGMTFTAPANPFRFRVELKCGACYYYGQEITDFE